MDKLIAQIETILQTNVLLKQLPLKQWQQLKQCPLDERKDEQYTYVLLDETFAFVIQATQLHVHTLQLIYLLVEKQTFVMNETEQQWQRYFLHHVHKQDIHTYVPIVCHVPHLKTLWGDIRQSINALIENAHIVALCEQTFVILIETTWVLQNIQEQTKHVKQTVIARSTMIQLNAILAECLSEFVQLRFITQQKQSVVTLKTHVLMMQTCVQHTQKMTNLFDEFWYVCAQTMEQWYTLFLPALVFEDYTFRKFLYTFFAQNQNINRVAEKLFMHRNTVQNYVQRFFLDTGYDLKQFLDAAFVYQALLAYEHDEQVQRL